MTYLKYPALILLLVLSFGLLLNVSPIRSLYRDRVLQQLSNQLNEVNERAVDFDKENYKLVALKLRLMSSLGARAIGQSLDASVHESEKTLSVDMFTVTTDVYPPSYVKSDYIVGEELKSIGDPLLTVLNLKIEELAQREHLSEVESGAACTFVRSIASTRLKSFEDLISSIIQNGKNNPLTWETIITAWRYNVPVDEDLLIRQVRNLRGWGRQYSIFVLGERSKSEASVDAISKALSDSSPAVRRHAIIALAKIGNPSSIDLLRGYAHADKDDIVRSLALRTVENLEKNLQSFEKN